MSGTIGHVDHGKSSVVKAISAITLSGMIRVGLLGGLDNGSRLPVQAHGFEDFDRECKRKVILDQLML
nr:hypothetical protein [Tanacetum cinerariifolium]GEY77861.1 hypothetical protein [Tanacetum cinerariifolium]